MKARNWKRIFCLSLLAVIIITSLVAAPQAANAFGDFNSNSDYGGSGRKRSDSDSDGISIYALFRIATLISDLLGIKSPYITFLLLILIVVILKYGVGALKKSGRQNTHEGIRQGAEDMQRGPDSSILQLTEDDPGFDADALRERVKTIFEKMQTCWENGNIEPLRNDFMPDAWTRFNTQLQNKKAAGETTHVRNILFDDVTLLRYATEGGHQMLKIRITVTHNIWVTNDKGKCIQGTEKTRKKFEFIWTMLRPAGSVTGGVTAADETHCSNCGAEVDLEVFAECPFCHTPIMAVSPDWVVSEIDAVSQTTLHS